MQGFGHGPEMRSLVPKLHLGMPLFLAKFYFALKLSLFAFKLEVPHCLYFRRGKTTIAPDFFKLSHDVRLDQLRIGDDC